MTFSKGNKYTEICSKYSFPIQEDNDGTCWIEIVVAESVVEDEDADVEAPPLGGGSGAVHPPSTTMGILRLGSNAQPLSAPIPVADGAEGVILKLTIPTDVGSAGAPKTGGRRARSRP
jgi:hypothetical protein